MELRDGIRRIALAWPAHGYRRITAELHRQDWEVNHKLVLRLMREDNLLCIRRRKFVPTTDSRHGRRVYPHLAEAMVLTGIDQLRIVLLPGREQRFIYHRTATSRLTGCLSLGVHHTGNPA
jgi:transposase InsO family protein